MKLLLVGVDGLDYRAYRTFGKRYCFPLRSPFPVTGPAWTSMYTGQAVAEHGVTDAWGRKDEKSRGAKELADECIWVRFPAATHIGLYNMPMAFLPTERELDFYVPGFPAADHYEPELQKLSKPPQPQEYWDERDGIEDDLKTEDDWWCGKTAFNVFDTLRPSRLAMAAQFVDYAQTFGVDFGAIGFRWIDRMCHIIGTRMEEWAESDKVNVELVDELLDYLLTELEPDSWIVASDHGTFRNQHTMLGTLISGGEHGLTRLLERRWWGVHNVAELIAKGMDIPQPERRVPELIPYDYLRISEGTCRVAGRLSEMSTIRLNLGCGQTPIAEPEWVNIDVMDYPGVDMVHDLVNGLPFPDESITEIRAFDVLEHLSYVINSTVLGEWCRVLKPGGTITLRSPDLGASAKAYAAGQLDFLGLLQKAYGRACSLNYDTHFSGIDWSWVVGQLTYWGCSEIQRLPDEGGDPYALIVQATKGEVPETKDFTGSWEGSEDIRKRLEAMGYL